MGVKKSRGWLTIVYPESEKEGWLDDLASIGQQCIVSPLHDKDINQGTGEPKKPHWHVLLLWDGPTTENNAKTIISMINGVGCIPCMSIRGSVRYFCHLDNPDKAQYNKEGIRQIGGLDIDFLMISENDEDILLDEMYECIREFNFIIYADFVDYCRMNHKEWFHLINHKFRENIWKYIRSLEYEVEKNYENKQGTKRSHKKVSSKE